MRKSRPYLITLEWMAQVIRAPRAEQDIRDALKYMNARWSRSQALQYAELIRDAEIAIA